MKLTMKIKWKTEYHPQITVKEKEGVTYLTYPALEETGIVRHGFSTRLGGVSKGHLASMNLSFSRGDADQSVYENYRRLAKALDILPESIVCSDQTHTTNILTVGKEHCGMGIFCKRSYQDIDGLITDEPGVTLATFYADCVPLYLVDPVHKAIGLAHSGWRGTVGKIGTKLAAAMGDAYGTCPADLVAAIGPSICQDCYEVSEDVAEAFRDVYGTDAIAAILTDGKKPGKYQLNLWEACRRNFMEAGIRSEKISMPSLCTCCNPDFLFSHRASKGMRGNLGAFLALK